MDYIDATYDRSYIGATLGIKYWYPITKNGKFGIEPRALGTYFVDTQDDENNYAFVKACVALNYRRVRLEANWESNDLIH
ncbi:MAG: hypothetical protein IJU50_02040, partial [Lachnospiraceae bacterium]|nr:hypothetical protein [Lachnospiraceae bacterium]